MESTSYTVNAQGQHTIKEDAVVDPAILKASPTQSTEVENIASSIPLPGSPANTDTKTNTSDQPVTPTATENEATEEKPVRKGLLETPVRPDVSMHLKMDASQKQSMADKTGNSLLRVQARAEQSIADKLGGRRALTNKAAAASIPAVQSEIAQISSDLVALKMNAAFKRSIADRLGDENLRREAQIAQSIADKMGARKAMLQSGKIAQQQGRAFADQVKKQKPATVASAAAPAQSQAFSPKSALKLTAAVTRSIADRLDNPALREEARRKQSQADKAGARRALLQTGPITKLSAATEPAATTTTKKGLLKKPATFIAKAQAPILEGHPRAINCVGCGASFPMASNAVGPSLSSHLKEFPDHQKKLDDVPEKDRVYIAKENYKGSFDHNFADPLNFVITPASTTPVATAKLEVIAAIPLATAAFAAL